MHIIKRRTRKILLSSINLGSLALNELNFARKATDTSLLKSISQHNAFIILQAHLHVHRLGVSRFF